jgi:hypothetical protein
MDVNACPTGAGRDFFLAFATRDAMSGLGYQPGRPCSMAAIPAQTDVTSRRLFGIPLTIALLVSLPLDLVSSPGRSASAAVTQSRVRCDLDVRNAHAMAFDTVRHATVMFSGADASRVRKDTCAWSGDERQWTFVTDRGPSARTFPAMAVDEGRGEVVLFGGNRVLFGAPTEWNTLLDDTWVLRGATWTRKSTNHGPSARAEAAIAYDKVRKRIVLFGGYSRTAQGRLRLGDTWEWDGERWSLATTVPAHECELSAAMNIVDRQFHRGHNRLWSARREPEPPNGGFTGDRLHAARQQYRVFR